MLRRRIYGPLCALTETPYPVGYLLLRLISNSALYFGTGDWASHPDFGTIGEMSRDNMLVSTQLTFYQVRLTDSVPGVHEQCAPATIRMVQQGRSGRIRRQGNLRTRGLRKPDVHPRANYIGSEGVKAKTVLRTK